MTEYITATTELAKRLNLFPRLRSAARGITLPLYDNPTGIENKSETDYDPVTDADIKAEKVLRAIIQEAFPDDNITGEELEDVTGTNNYTWTLDPIDGTRAFIAGVPVWSTLIALSECDKPVLGMIDLPALQQSYMGAPDKNGECLMRASWRLIILSATGRGFRGSALMRSAMGF